MLAVPATKGTGVALPCAEPWGTIIPLAFYWGSARDVIEGIAAANKNDGRRLERGAVVLDDLYELFRRKR